MRAGKTPWVVSKTQTPPPPPRPPVPPIALITKSLPRLHVFLPPDFDVMPCWCVEAHLECGVQLGGGSAEKMFVCCSEQVRSWLLDCSASNTAAASTAGEARLLQAATSCRVAVTPPSIINKGDTVHTST